MRRVRTGHPQYAGISRRGSPVRSYTGKLEFSGAYLMA